ncbi:MAG TPA: GrpB family protein [Candidatus Acidoferrales bacterium]|nr:GrpB family protein [Candidatus Acidoferrales bacterium]
MSPAKQDHDGTPVLSEEELRACTIGELQPLVGGIRIVDADPEWPNLFAREAERIRAALGARALRIEHVGSTSVPQLPAKPVIDMLLLVEDSANEASYAPALEGGGYVLRIREPVWYEHRMFKGPDTDVNLHVFSPRCTEVERMLLFRDWLRNNPIDRELYAQTKMQLAREEWKYVQNYADAKTAVIREILSRASSACSGTALRLSQKPAG